MPVINTDKIYETDIHNKINDVFDNLYFIGCSSVDVNIA